MVASQTAINKLSSFGTARATIQGAPLSDEELRKTEAFFSACNYLALGMIYLQDNPLLREPLRAEHIKNRLLGHWGASPALSFTYTHLNRVIKRDDLDMILWLGQVTARRVCLPRCISRARIRKFIQRKV